MVVFLTFVNSPHQWSIIKRFPPCSTSAPLFASLGFVPLGGLDWRCWDDSSIFIFLYCARPCHTSYGIYWDIDPPYILVAMIDCWVWLHLVHLWPWIFRFDMVPFCILSDHYSFISYTYVGSTCIFMAMLYMDVYVPEISFLTFISLTGTFTRAFRSWILCSLSILSCFLYNVFRLSSSPLTSHIRGHLLYTRMAPLRLSVNFPYVGTQKDTYGLRFS